ncbi:methionine-R-sulfoxide reductase B3 isoform X4 [Dromaius novaehollandiae]|uniref:methionine-R-sulfoxide reductase B3 isoform X4 n=1 Tax=Dromaius novaehollandiae TaxID=8790 RepID=UPI00311D6B7B
MLIFGVGCRCPGISRHASLAAGARPCHPGGAAAARSLGPPSPCALRRRRRRCSSPRSSWRPPQLLPLFFASRFVGEDITVMSAFNLLHLVTKSQPVALRACGLPSGSCRDKKDCKVVFSQEELRKRLTPLQYHVTQEKGTESAFEGEYTHHKAQGIYKCVVCGTPLFKSTLSLVDDKLLRIPDRLNRNEDSRVLVFLRAIYNLEVQSTSEGGPSI